MNYFKLVLMLSIISVVACKKEKPGTIEAPDYSLPSNTGNSINFTVYNDGSLSNTINWSGIIYPDPISNAAGFRAYYYKTPVSYTPDIVSACTDTTLEGKAYLEYINQRTPSVGGIVEKTTNSFTYVPSNTTIGQAGFYTCGWRIANLPNCVCRYYMVLETTGDSYIPSMTYVMPGSDELPSINLPDVIQDKTKELVIPVYNADYIELMIQDSLNDVWKTKAQLSGGNKLIIPAGSLNQLTGSANYKFWMSGSVRLHKGQSVNNKNFLYVFQSGQNKTISIR